MNMKREREWYVHRVKNEIGGVFFLGNVFAPTKAEAVEAAEKRWPHWEEELRVNPVGPGQSVDLTPAGRP